MKASNFLCRLTSMVLVFSCLIQPASAAPAWQRLHLPVPGQQAGYDFPVYANHKLSGDLSALRAIREVIIVQHGIQRNGGDYYAAAMELLQASGRSPDEVLVLAPNFPGKPDVDNPLKGFDRMPVWSVQGWTGGDAALPGTGTQAGLSSLQVLDDIAQLLADKSRMPSLKKIIFAGHSGGGQLIHRYAVLNHVDEALRARGLDVQYVVANPSSYLYFTPDRPDRSGSGSFAPYDKTVCPAYDDYRYGMQNMVAYAKGMLGVDLYIRHLQRQVTYLIGSMDNDPNHRVLDKSCGAEAEGPTRYDRAHAYWAYEQYLGKHTPVAKSIPTTASHHYFDVQGVGHDQSKMFGSQCGIKLLFGDKSVVDKQAATCSEVDFRPPQTK